MKKLITLSTKEIKLYTLMSNIIKIETCDKNNFIIEVFVFFEKIPTIIQLLFNKL